jgi:ATP-dependent Clp protease ATP-binding subunit ClpC
MTSNVGSQQAYAKRLDSLGFKLGGDTREVTFDETVDKRLQEALRHTFRPEFLNRIDETIVFKRLTRPELRLVVERLLGDLRARLAERGVRLELGETAGDWLVEHGFDETYGARPLRRLIQREIENRLARQVLAGDYQPGDAVRVLLDDGKLSFERVVGEPVEASAETVPAAA